MAAAPVDHLDVLRMFPGNRHVFRSNPPPCRPALYCEPAQIATSLARADSRRVVNLVVMTAWILSSLVILSGCATLPSAPAAPAAPASAQAGGATIVAIAPPSPPAITLPKFLGLDVAFAGIRGVGLRVRNRLGTRFPGLEPRPPIRSISDPANMDENASPAVKAAAEAKVEADQAPQKAKAIRYLATLGCGKCYPDNEDALLAAMEDCNEMIRYEAVRGLRKSVGDQCGCCRQSSCCSPKLVQKLYQLAYGVDDSGCPIEPSSRVRRNARLAIQGCGGVQTVGGDMIPDEGPPTLVDEPEAPTEAPVAAAAAADQSDPLAEATLPIEGPSSNGTVERTATILLDSSESLAERESSMQDQTAQRQVPDTERSMVE